METKVDLIIPLKGNLISLRGLLAALEVDCKLIRKVIVVHSSRVQSSVEQNLESDKLSIIRSRSFVYRGLDVAVYKSAQALMPGQARNFGISKSNAQYVAFLDQNTIPCMHWIRNSIRLMQAHDRMVLCGSTRYSYTAYIQKVIIASSYGFLPLTTIPGSVLDRRALIRLGYFLPNVRAAEDIAFLSRVYDFYGTQLIHRSHGRTLTYTLQSSSISYYVYKWFRNYKSSAPYTLLSLQQIALLLSLMVSLLLMAYSWNSLLAGWAMDSPLYIPFVSRITFALIVTFYIVGRGFLIPFKKGAYRGHCCNILDLPLILAISFLLDLSKSAALIYRLVGIHGLRAGKS